ncbi:hypothetical protein IMG5_014170, partial [Ichthyophthirius multifiliis]
MLQKIFNKKTDEDNNDYSCKQKVSLPENFADRVFNLELELETLDIDIKNVVELLELYSKAIEYYENMKDEKFIIFKNKITSLLMKQNVNMAMDNAQEQHQQEVKYQYINIKQIKQYQKLMLDNYDEKNSKFQRLKEIQNKLKYIYQQDNWQSVRVLLNNHDQEMKYHMKLILKECESQTDIINRRLQIRKKKNKMKSYQDLDKQLDISINNS